MSFAQYRDVQLTMGEALDALGDTWRQKVKQHFARHGVHREPTASECLVYYVITVKCGGKRQYADQQQSLFGES